MGEGVKQCTGRQLRLMALALAFALPAASVELVGTTRATFEWTPSTGDVFGYEVYVERNGGPPLYVELVSTPRATIEAQYDDKVTVRVRAVGFRGDQPIHSAFSEPSVAVKFLEPPRFGGDGTLTLQCGECGTIEFHSIADGGILGELTLAAGSWRIVGAGDSDGDGERDLIWREEQTGALLVSMLSHFAPVGGAYSSEPSLVDRRAVGMGDFDRDGAVEFVLQSMIGGAVEHWKVDGDRLVLLSTIAGEPGHDLVAVADFDGDQRPDLLWHDPELGALQFWRMQGLSRAGAIGIASQIASDWEIVGTGDYDGDGSVDVLWRNWNDGALSIWYLRDGQFSREAHLPGIEEDDAREVAGSADFTGVFGEEIVLQHVDTGEVSILFPFSEFAPSRLRIATPGARWRVVDVAN